MQKQLHTDAARMLAPDSVRLASVTTGAAERTCQAWAEMIKDGGLEVTQPLGGVDHVVEQRALLDILEENLLYTDRHRWSARRSTDWSETTRHRL